MKTARSILYLICSSVMMAQSVHLSVPAADAANNPVTIGMAYFTWGQFTGNDGITVQAGQLTRPVTNGTIDVTLPASDNAGYVYTLLFMHGSTADTFKWRVPAAGASAMAELNQPPATTNDAAAVYTDQANTYTAGKKQTFSASGTTAGEAFAGVSADPTAAVAGDRWFRTDLHHMRIHDGTTAQSVMYQSDSLPANQLTNPAAATSLLFAANPFNLTFGSATGSGNMMSILDTPGNTGTGYVFTAGTASGSSAKPFQVLAGGVKVIDVNAAGAITLGSGSTNVSALQLTTASGNTSPNLDFKNAAGAPLAFWETAWRNNDAGRADFGLGLGYFSPSNGAVHRNNVLSYGYNCGSGTSKQLSSDHAFCMRIESDYTTSESIRQLEFYFDYKNAANSINYRPFWIIPHLDLGTVDVQMRANNIVFGYDDTSNDWLTLGSFPSEGDMTFSNNSFLLYNGSNTDWIKDNGHPLLGFTDPGTGRLFSDAFTANFFSGNVIGGPDLSLVLGNPSLASRNRGLRWNASNGWQFQTGDSTWQNMGTVLGIRSTAGGIVGIGPASFANTGGASAEVYDATPITGFTRLAIRSGAGQSGNLLEMRNNADSIIGGFDLQGKMTAASYRFQGSTIAALQSDFDAAHPLLLKSSAGIGFSSTTDWFGTPDIGINRNAATAGVLEVNSGTAGTMRDIVVRHYIAGGTSPTIASGFGTSPAIAGKDAGGRITVGSGGAATTGTITFGTAFPTAPACVANDESTILLVQAKATTATLTLTSASAWTAGDKLTWHCTGY